MGSLISPFDKKSVDKRKSNFDDHIDTLGCSREERVLGKCQHILPELSRDCWTGGDIELGGKVPGGGGVQKGNVGGGDYGTNVCLNMTRR